MPAPKVAGRARPQDVDRYVGARMRERRVMLGLTQQQMADLIGVTYEGLQIGGGFAPSPSQRMLLDLARNFLNILDPRHREAVATLARALAESDDGDQRAA